MIQLWIAMASFSSALIISPGPGNALLAANGASFGYRRTLPFLFGFDTANLVLSLVYGFGLVNIFERYPSSYQVFKIAGVLYIFYLAYKFFTASSSSSSEAQKAEPMGYRDGFFVVMLNPKIHAMFPLIYSQFLDPNGSLTAQVFILTAIFVVLCLVCHSIWIAGGDLIFRRFQSAGQQRAQNIFFGVMVAAVGVYIFLT